MEPALQPDGVPVEDDRLVVTRAPPHHPQRTHSKMLWPARVRLRGSRAELGTYLALIKGPDHGRAFLQIMRSTERTAAKQARYRSAVRNVPYPVQALWAADDPAMTLAGYGEKARAAAALARLHTVPGKHFPQEDQAPAIASQIAESVLSQQNADPRT